MSLIALLEIKNFNLSSGEGLHYYVNVIKCFVSINKMRCKMQKTAKLFYNLTCAIGCLVGIMHFFAPYSFNWFSYIPNAPIEIYQSINYVNFCFSFLLAGLSLLLIIVQKTFFEGFQASRIFYSFFVLVWLSRVAIQLVWPWPSGLQKWLVLGFTIESIFAIIPMIHLFKQGEKRQEQKRRD